MEIDPIELMSLCIAMFDHVAGQGGALSDLDQGAVAAARLELAQGLDMLMGDEDVAASSIDALRPMVREMSADDMQEGIAVCMEMAEDP